VKKRHQGGFFYGNKGRVGEVGESRATHSCFGDSGHESCDSGHESRDPLARFHHDPIDFPHGEKVRLMRAHQQVSLNQECIISRLVNRDIHGVLKVARFLFKLLCDFTEKMILLK